VKEALDNLHAAFDRVERELREAAETAGTEHRADQRNLGYQADGFVEAHKNLSFADDYLLQPKLQKYYKAVDTPANSEELEREVSEMRIALCTAPLKPDADGFITSCTSCVETETGVWVCRKDFHLDCAEGLGKGDCKHKEIREIR